MKSVLVIGLGNFGMLIVKQIHELGHQVMAIDKNESRVNEALPYVTNALIGDSTNANFLESLGINNYDVCIETIGNDFQSSLETTSLLKELGGKMVVSRANREVQEKFLLRNGADEVVNPEKQTFHCFACGEHGDVIDFVSKLFHLSLYDAAQKLAADFHLTPDKPPSAAALHAKRIQTEAQQLRENERLCFSVLSDYAHVLRDWKVQYAPQSPDEPVHARFMEACHKLNETEYYLDILCAGDSHERAEVIHQQMADGKLDRLRQHLEKIHEEETEDGYNTADVA